MTAPPDSLAASLRAAALANADKLRALPTKAQWEVLACLRELGDEEAAADVLESLAEWHGPLAKVLDARASLFARLGRYDEALAAARERLDRFPSTTGELVLARTCLASGALAEAAEIASRLAQAAGGNDTALALLGDVALEVGDAEQAQAHFERLLEARDGSVLARRGLARAWAARGDDDAAREMLATLVTERAEQPTPGSARELAALARELDEHQLAARLRAEVDQHWAARAALVLDSLTGAAALPIPVATGDAASPAALHVVAQQDDIDPAPAVLAVARDYFGFTRLRAGQATTIARALAGEDTLAVMPTGAGKSLCYQLPAMLLPGVTVVISPLIALMQDQLESLPAAVAKVATLINSTLDGAELRRRQAGIAKGDYKLVYAAPERLRQAPFLRALAAAGVSLFVVDEAHCISLWGHDFRPDYLVIPRALASLGAPPLLALTATATPAMAAEIGARLERTPGLVRASSFRSNLFYAVRHHPNREAKLRDLVEFCREHDGAGIVYVTSRDGCEQVAQVLNRELKRRRYDPDIALAYHAGFDPDERAQRMRAFMTGETRIIVATVAFGMGVDKADIRFVAHLSPANSLEAYSQESGRAGRDGRHADCILFYSPADKSTLKQRANKDELDVDLLRRCYAHLRRVLGTGWRVVTLADATPADWDEQRDIRVALGILERAALLARHADAPRTLELAWRGGIEPVGDRWVRFKAIAGLVTGQRQVLDLVDAGAALGLSPAQLEQQLVDWRTAGWDAQFYPARRDLCIRLVLPAPPDAASALPALLDEVRRENARRVERIVAYAVSRSCRHATIAAHLGEQLAACGTMCDVCVGAVTRPAPALDRAGALRDNAGPVARPDGVAAARAALDCARGMPFPVGKSGLAKVLIGSIAAPVKRDRAPGFGALAGMPVSRVNELIERLIEAGLLARDEQHEYRLLSLTPRGEAATAADLVTFAVPAPRAARSDGAAKSRTARQQASGEYSVEEPEWSPEERALLETLKEWRGNEARERAVPPYLIAHDRTLHELIARRPRTLEELLAVRGFGASKVETYGAQLLGLLNRA